jgi:hypothetical protein
VPARRGAQHCDDEQDGTEGADDQVIGMPSRAVDEAWHGLILCTALYADFCQRAYGTFLHHHPDSGTPDAFAMSAGSPRDQLGRTVVAWHLVAQPGEHCVLWDLDHRVGMDEPWGVPAERVAAIEEVLAAQAGARSG